MVGTTRTTKQKFDRLTVISIGFIIFSALVLIKLGYIQLVDAQNLKNIGKKQHFSTRVLKPTRGQIFIQDQRSNQLYPVATDRRYFLLSAVTKSIADPLALARKLTPLLGLAEDKVQEIADKLSKKTDVYESIKHKLTEEEKKSIAGLADGNLRFSEENFRYYPEKNILAQVLGFVGYKGDELVGRYGLEGYFEKLLAGISGEYTYEKDASGRLIPIADRSLSAVKDGSSLVLTIDRSIQFAVCQSLAKWGLKVEAESGEVVVVDPKSGEIMAMCNYPDFDPNKYNEVEDIGVYNNKAVSEPYEPGSVFKAFTMAAALDQNKVTPLTVYNDTGVEEIAGFKIKNSDGKAHGLTTMTEVLESSLNTGAIFAARSVGPEKFREYLKAFGFGEMTEVTLASERAGNLSSLNQGHEIDMATGSYGQGITATPLQIALAFSAIANGGVLMKPLIVKEIQEPLGKIQKFQPQSVRQVISQQTAITLSGMLASVVKYGHAKHAAVDGYFIAGKTGTAQVYDPATKKYSTSLTNHTFAGFAPVENPRFVVVAHFKYPKNAAWADSSTAPLFGEIAQYLLNYLKVPATN